MTGATVGNKVSLYGTPSCLLSVVLICPRLSKKSFSTCKLADLIESGRPGIGILSFSGFDRQFILSLFQKLPFPLDSFV